MKIEDFQLSMKLGSGSFGVVYKARQKATNNIYVIKVVDCSKMNDKLKKNAMEQGRVLKQANSPFVVKHFNTFINKSTLYIVMEYCPKGDLANFMKSQMGKPLKQQTIWKFSIQMMGALRDLHAKKILHRDIKTLNVFLDQQLNVKIGDLGVAKSMTSEFAHTIVGTPYYLSPEMCQQKPYNQKTDIWAMGCVIYQLCTGRRPFQANNQAALALKIVMGKYASLPNYYSADLVWVVKSCLSIDYKRRPSALYLLEMPKTKQWAQRLKITLNLQQKDNKNKENNIKQNKNSKKDVPNCSQILQIKLQTKIPQKLSKQKIAQDKQIKEIAKQKPKQLVQQQQAERFAAKIQLNSKQKIKLSKQGQNNVRQVLNKKILKPVKFSGSKRLENAEKQVKQKTNSKIINDSQKLMGVKKSTDCIQNNLRIPKQEPTNKNQELSSLKYRSQPSKFSQSDKQKLMNATRNRFLPESIQKKKLIDLEDQQKIQEHKISQNSQSDSSQNNQKMVQKNEQNKSIFLKCQVKMEEDDIMKQFDKKNNSLKKVDRTQNKQKFQLQNQLVAINWNQIEKSEVTSNGKSSYVLAGDIPTLRKPSSKQIQKLQQLKLQQASQSNVQQQIDENRAYISSEEESGEEQMIQQQLLIQDFDKIQQQLLQKMRLNNNRKQELLKMKQHFMPQILKLMPQQQFQKLKEKAIFCKQDQVQNFVGSWKNNIKNLNLFYRVLHFDMQITRCQQNILLIKEKIQKIKS